MPQMMPLLWSLSLLFSIFMLLLIISFLYFFSTLNLSFSHSFMSTLTKQHWIWKW
uniref:ATP synthase F0 subunit 8 n=1 Tax=Wasmannia auropunctata TaxID=64793 RepID=A0A191TFU6_WASAN|nr:ATP synthase F0 subunit 8 [Wasmannia auropunctata]ANI87507.1 ATP synthase F0 subunit 8 [Wasmannia auropunctata]